MDVKEIKKEFKDLKKVYFELANPYILVWGVDKQGIPNEKIYLGRHGAPRPDYSFTPYEIERLECTKPGLFRPGVISVIGTGNVVLVNVVHKKKSNMKMCEIFNESLALYKKYNLGK